jgi:glycosyltransferase involved in cell wall biosynthesis
VTKPLLSTIIPVFNGERFLAQAIESALAQDYSPFEVIVIDDGSTDQSAAIARSFPGIQYLYQANQGVAAAKNAGVRAAMGEFIAFLDCDDTWPVDKLSKQTAFLLEHPDVGCVFGNHTIVVDEGQSWPAWLRTDALATEAGRLMTTIVVRKELFERVGPFDPSYEVGEDTDWLARALDAGVRTAKVPDIVLYRLIHDSNLSSRVDLHHEKLKTILRSSVLRKRNARPDTQGPVN